MLQKTVAYQDHKLLFGEWHLLDFAFMIVTSEDKFFDVVDGLIITEKIIL